MYICWLYSESVVKFPEMIFQDNDLPETAVASLFASAKRNNDQFGQYSAIAESLTTLPSEAQVQVWWTVFEGLVLK